MLATFLDSCITNHSWVSTFPDPVTWHTGFGTRMSLNHFKFVTKEAAEDMEKALSWGTLRVRTQFVPKVFSEWKIARENALEDTCP